MDPALKRAKELIRKDEDFVIAKIVDSHGSAPRKTGAWILMEKNGTCHGTVGGGLVEARVIEKMPKLFETKTPETHKFNLNRDDHDALDMRCGGDVEVKIEYIKVIESTDFIEEFNARSKAIIFGAGHVGLALEHVLRYVGFETVVVDDRGEYANSDRFPFAEIHVIESYDDAFAGIETNQDSYIVIVTRGHAGDYNVLKQSLMRQNAYIGMIGSKKKVTETLQMVRDEDGISQEKIDKVYSPIGISIHAETPEEIAISITAEMISVRAGYGK